MTADHHREMVARALEHLGAPHRATALRRCGRTATRHACDACGDPLALVVHRVTCGLRCCPDCARAQAQERVRQMAGAVEHVADTVHARAITQQLVEARAELDARARSEYWTRRASNGSARCAELARAADRDADDARFRAGRVVELLRGEWGWKLVTLSPRWDPSDPAETTPAGIRARTLALFDALAEAVRRRYGVGGLAAWSVSAETSAGGHVHAHALVFGPFLVREALARAVSRNLGREVMVDVRRAKARRRDETDAQAAAREALKYALKGPSPRRAAWVLGEQTATVPAPELSAAVTLGLLRVQTVRHRGTVRDALRAARLRRVRRAAAPPVCASCGTVLDTSAGELDSWRRIVGELRRRREWATCDRATAPPELSPVRLRWTGPEGIALERIPRRVLTLRGAGKPNENLSRV